SPWSNEVLPVVFSAITPSEKVHVFIGESFSEDKDSKDINYTDTRVYISEKDSVWIKLTPNPQDSSIYTDDASLIQVKPGSTYLLKVKINNKTVYSQTTVPAEGGEIIQGECTVVSDRADGSVNGTNYSTNICVLMLKLKLPDNRNYGCYLTAFSNRIDFYPFLTSESYLEPNFIVNKNISSFNVNIITVDSNLKKFMLAESVSSYMFDSNDIADVLGSYGGVYPAFSNIENGIGVFGSFVKKSRLITLTNK
ncbi:MAG: DUF4249 family protein, partial [Paludibacter sp.]|nr:DUF4249 family protein [Paludibacter sp.]